VLEKLGLDAVVVHIHFGMSGSFRTFLYPSKFTFLFLFFFLSFFLSFFQNQRRLQVRRAQKDAEGEMMV
jgi:preprotein translocase subunit SecG